MSRPGARPTLNTPKKEKRKHKVNQQNKTKRKKKFRSFSSSLAGTHNSLCVTVCVLQWGEARAQKAASPPAPCRWRRRYCCLSLQQEGHRCPSIPPLPQCAGGCSFTTWKMGQKEGEGLSGPRGEAGQGKMRKVTAQRWRWYHRSQSSLLLGHLLWSRFRCSVCQTAEDVTL